MTISQMADNGCSLYAGDKTDTTIMIAFGGLARSFGGVPGFEFLTSLSDIPVQRIFLADPAGLWYQKGIPGMGDNVWEVAENLKRFCTLNGAKRIVTLGNSAGGFAAILFGALIGADEVHAFAPKTRLVDDRDYRDVEELRELHRRIGPDRSMLDLCDFLLQNELNSARIFIHFPKRDRMDAYHARNLAGVPNVKLIGYPWRDHYLIGALRKNGSLKSLLSAIASGDQRMLVHTIRKSRLALSRDLHAWFPVSFVKRFYTAKNHIRLIFAAENTAPDEN